MTNPLDGFTVERAAIQTIGSLMGTRIPYFRSPVAGLPMVHWN